MDNATREKILDDIEDVDKTVNIISGDVDTVNEGIGNIREDVSDILHALREQTYILNNLKKRKHDDQIYTIARRKRKIGSWEIIFASSSLEKVREAKKKIAKEWWYKKYDFITSIIPLDIIGNGSYAIFDREEENPHYDTSV